MDNTGKRVLHHNVRKDESIIHDLTTCPTISSIVPQSSLIIPSRVLASHCKRRQPRCNHAHRCDNHDFATHQENHVAISVQIMDNERASGSDDVNDDSKSGHNPDDNHQSHKGCCASVIACGEHSSPCSIHCETQRQTQKQQQQTSSHSFAALPNEMVEHILSFLPWVMVHDLYTQESKMVECHELDASRSLFAIIDKMHDVERALSDTHRNQHHITRFTVRDCLCIDPSLSRHRSTLSSWSTIQWMFGKRHHTIIPFFHHHHMLHMSKLSGGKDTRGKMLHYWRQIPLYRVSHLYMTLPVIGLVHGSTFAFHHRAHNPTHCENTILVSEIATDIAAGATDKITTQHNNGALANMTMTQPSTKSCCSTTSSHPLVPRRRNIPYSCTLYVPTLTLFMNDHYLLELITALLLYVLYILRNESADDACPFARQYPRFYAWYISWYQKHLFAEHSSQEEQQCTKETHDDDRCYRCMGTSPHGSNNNNNSRSSSTSWSNHWSPDRDNVISSHTIMSSTRNDDSSFHKEPPPSQTTLFKAWQRMWSVRRIEWHSDHHFGALCDSCNVHWERWLFEIPMDLEFASHGPLYRALNEWLLYKCSHCEDHETTYGFRDTLVVNDGTINNPIDDIHDCTTTTTIAAPSEVSTTRNQIRFTNSLQCSPFVRSSSSSILYRTTPRIQWNDQEKRLRSMCTFGTTLMPLGVLLRAALVLRHVHISHYNQGADYGTLMCELREHFAPIISLSNTTTKRLETASQQNTMLSCINKMRPRRLSVKNKEWIASVNAPHQTDDGVLPCKVEESPSAITMASAITTRTAAVDDAIPHHGSSCASVTIITTDSITSADSELPQYQQQQQIDYPIPTTTMPSFVQLCSITLENMLFYENGTRWLMVWILSLPHLRQCRLGFDSPCPIVKTNSARSECDIMCHQIRHAHDMMIHTSGKHLVRWELHMSTVYLFLHDLLAQLANEYVHVEWCLPRYRFRFS